MSLDPNQPGDEQLDIVRGLKGVRYAFYLDREILGILRRRRPRSVHPPTSPWIMRVSRKPSNANA